MSRFFEAYEIASRYLHPSDENELVSQEQTPPIEYEPPYSMDFVSHLDAGCYPDEITPRLLTAVRRDAPGARMLDDLAIVQLELRLYGSQ